MAAGRERRRWREAKDQEYERPAFSPDGRTVAVSVRRYDRATNTSETFIELWDIASPTEHRPRIPGGWARLGDLKFSPDGQILATASTGHRDQGEGTRSSGPGRSQRGLGSLPRAGSRARFPLAGPLTFSPDGKLLAVAVTDGTVRLYDLTTGQERDIEAFPSKPSAMSCLARIFHTNF